MSSEQQSLITLHVDNVGFIGVFDKRTGGEATATPVKHRAGGMGPEKVYPVLAVYSDNVLSRVYEQDRDITSGLFAQLLQQAGRSGATVTEQPLDSDGAVVGAPRIYRGQLGTVNPGDADSTSQNPRMFTVTQTVTTVSG